MSPSRHGRYPFDDAGRPGGDGGLRPRFRCLGGYAPLEGAAFTSGFVAAAGQNQRVQHLEGGIVARILVSEGESIKAGAVLFELDPTSATAQKNQLEKKLVSLKARAARLTAERDRLATPDFAGDVTAGIDAAEIEEP